MNVNFFWQHGHASSLLSFFHTGATISFDGDAMLAAPPAGVAAVRLLSEASRSLKTVAKVWSHDVFSLKSGTMTMNDLMTFSIWNMNTSFSSAAPVGVHGTSEILKLRSIGISWCNLKR